MVTTQCYYCSLTLKSLMYGIKTEDVDEDFYYDL